MRYSVREVVMSISDSVQAICCICKGDADYECVKCGRGICEACANYVTVFTAYGVRDDPYCRDCYDRYIEEEVESSQERR